MVKKVFYIEKEKFLRSMIEVALKGKKAEIYTVETLKDNFYLLSDLTPHLIIFDLDTVSSEEIEQLFQLAPEAKFVAMGKESPREAWNSRLTAFFPKPLVVFGLADRLLSLVD